MLLRTYVPPMPLSMFVDYFWYMEGYKPSHSTEMALPDGSVDVIIDLGEDRIRLFDCGHRELVFGSSILCGPHSDFFVIDTAHESKVIGIHFHPGGIHPFLQEPLDEIHNQHLSLDVVWGTAGSDMRDELLASHTPDDMFQVLQRRLSSLAVKELVWHPAIHFVLNHLHGSQIHVLMNQIGFSHRHFNHIFKETVGMTPKRLNRILRFQEALSVIHSGERVAWATIALACGYYDQSHFMKEFQSFSGINPSEYRPIPGRHHNHAACIM